MKKTFVLACTIAAATLGAVAQDTIDGRKNMENYYYCGELETYEFGGIELPRGGEMARRFSTVGDMTIYGIAAAVMEAHSGNTVLDTSYDNAFEYLRIYLPDADSLRWVRQARVHLRHTPVAYYADFREVLPPSVSDRVVPIYESYFDSSVTVSDSFYAGMTLYIDKPWFTEDSAYDYRTWPLIPCFQVAVTPPGDTNFICHFHREYGSNTIVSRSWRRVCGTDLHFMFYPILTPESYVDTALSARGGDMVQRLTGVMPNPAKGSARVVSSLGLTRVEAYDAAGGRMLDIQASGLSVDIDVSRWPSGTYLLRITTPMGTTMKKLTVTR